MPDTGLRPWTRTQERLASPVIRLMTLLNAMHAELVELEIREPNLERVFLHLTDKALRD